VHPSRVTERERERESEAAGKRRGRMEIAQACNKSRYRSVISLERALAHITAGGRETAKGREGSERRLRERGLVLVGDRAGEKGVPNYAMTYRNAYEDFYSWALQFFDSIFISRKICQKCQKSVKDF
jgi:hypothetical protein